MNRLWIVILAACVLAPPAVRADEELILREGKWVGAAKPGKGTPAGEAALIRRDLAQKRYRSAVRRAKRFAKRYRDDPLREEVFALAGEAELRRGRHWKAYKWYHKQLSEFPSGQLVDRTLARQMEIAQAFLAGKKRRVLGFIPVSAEQEGIEILQRVADLAPGTPRAEMALLAVGDHYYAKGKWEDAAAGYEEFLQLSPKSPRAAHAELRLAESLLLSYRGPMWDAAPLIEAEQLYKAFAARHPAAASRAGTDQILKGIRAARARQQYEIGRFYVRTDKPAAAEYYFQLVARDYAGTSWAARAERALAKAGRRGAATPADAQSPAAEKPSQPSKETQE